ncbi:MAG: XrtA system polysaccharide chain length determinant [Syntrophales bacterium]
MINPRKSFHIHDYFEILLRRIWYFVVPFLVVALATSIYLIAAPRKYMASTLILVTPQKVPENFVKPTVTSKIEDRLQSIAQESLSRTRLEQIISELKLYRKESRWLRQEEIVELMRKNTRVEIKGKEGYFTISYVGNDPVLVTTVTNRLASMFIEENLKFREQQAQGTTEFLAQELASKKARLEEQEKAISTFKRRYMGELPEQREANLKILEQLQLLYQRIGESLRAAQDRKLILQKQIQEMEFSAYSTSDSSGSQIDELRNQLGEWAAKYTERHPDVIMLKKKISDMESRSDTSFVKRSPRYRELNAQLSAVDLEIARLNEEEAKTKSQINRYHQRIENTPIREQAMASMAREYQNTKETYETLLKKSQEAQQAENLEHRQKGEQFKIIDPARIPEKPFQPNIPRILIGGLLAGMMIGSAVAFVRENLDRSFYDAEDVEISLGLKVLANIPKFESKAV